MMNYIAIQFTSYFVALWENPFGSNTVGVINQMTKAGWFPPIFGQMYLLNVIIVLAVAVAMFAAMECASMLLLAPDAAVAVAGSLGPVIAPEMEGLLGREVHVYDEWCAARGLAGIAKAVFSGARSILGIGVQL